MTASMRKPNERLAVFGKFLLLTAVLGAIFGNEIFAWISLQLIVFTNMPATMKNRGRSRHLLWAFPSILLGIGFWLGLQSENALMHEIGVVCCLTGIGGMLGWFPVPSCTLPIQAEKESSSLKIEFLLSVLFAANLLFRCVQSGEWNEREIAVLAVISLLSLVMCGFRLMGTITIPQRCQLSILTILSHANIATVLLGWQKLHLDRNWSASSNILTAENLFLSILFIESFAVLLLLWGGSMIKVGKGKEIEAPLPRTFQNQIPTGSLAAILGVLILSGFPFFPGAWWRFKLTAALLLPHEQSLITKLSEPHHGFVSLALGYGFCSLIVAIGHLKVLPALLSVESASCQEPPIEASTR